MSVTKHKKRKKEINGLKEPEGKTISHLFVYTVYIINCFAIQLPSRNCSWSVVDLEIFIMCLLIYLTCLEEREAAVEMEELASCNPFDSKDALSTEPQDIPPQKKKKKKTRKKMAHIFSRWTPWLIFTAFHGIFITLVFIDMESEKQDLVNGDTQMSPSDKEEVTRKSRRKRWELKKEENHVCWHI